MKTKSKKATSNKIDVAAIKAKHDKDWSLKIDAVLNRIKITSEGNEIYYEVKGSFGTYGQDSFIQGIRELLLGDLQ